MTDNSSNFLSLEVVFQKKVSLQRHTAVNAYRLPVISSLWPQNKKSLLWYKHEHLMGQKSLTKKKFKNQNFSKKWKNFYRFDLWSQRDTCEMNCDATWKYRCIMMSKIFIFWHFGHFGPQDNKNFNFQISIFCNLKYNILISSGKLNRKIVW